MLLQGESKTMDLGLEMYTPDGTQNLISVQGMKLLVGTGLGVGAIWGISKVVATESKSVSAGAVDSLQTQF